MIRQFLDLSTAHLSNDAMAWLAEGAALNIAASSGNKPGGATIGTLGATLFGWFMAVPTRGFVNGDAGGMPDDLKAICAFARTKDCPYILFDADADIIDDLPVLHPDWQDDCSAKNPTERPIDATQPAAEAKPEEPVDAPRSPTVAVAIREAIENLDVASQVLHMTLSNLRMALRPDLRDESQPTAL